MDKQIKTIIYIGLKAQGIEDVFGFEHAVHFADHVTLKFGNISELPSFIGKEVTVRPINMFVDEKGQAITVSIDDPEMVTYSSGQRLHMTLSCANGVKPVYSNDLISDHWNKVDSEIAELYDWRDESTFIGKCFAFVLFTDGTVGEVYNK